MERRTVDVSEEASDGDEGYSTFGDGQSWAPLITQYVQTDAAVRIDIGVVDSSCEVDFGWLERIVGGKVDG